MSQKQGSGSGKRRKKGDWEAIARGRSHSRRDLATSRPNYGSGNYPLRVTDVGSAAYRRLLDSRTSTTKVGKR